MRASAQSRLDRGHSLFDTADRAPTDIQEQHLCTFITSPGSISSQGMIAHDISSTSGSRAATRKAALRNQVPPMRIRIIRAIQYALMLACGWTAVADALAADAAGVVKTLKGSVQIERAGGSSAAAIGSEVYGSDRIVTGPASAVGITLRDTTQLTAGANTILDLNKFAFNTTTHEGVLDASVKRGSLAVISGKLAKANPDSVRFSTPTTTLGVRGTEFIIEVGDKKGE
jgi:hypothetical protein